MKQKHFNIGYFYAIATGVLGGFVPIVFKKALVSQPLPNATALFIKLAASLLVLVPMAIPKIGKVRVAKDVAWKLPICSFLYIATLVFLYESYKQIGRAHV